MDYFELFGITETLNPDLKTLEKKFFELSKLHHPDRGGEEEMSSLINEAYSTLKDKKLLAHYLFKKHGIPEDKKNIPLELSEEYFDADSDEHKKAALKTKVRSLVTETKKQIDQIKVNELIQLREKYTYLAYLESMIRNLEGNHDY